MDKNLFDNLKVDEIEEKDIQYKPARGSFSVAGRTSDIHLTISQANLNYLNFAAAESFSTRSFFLNSLIEQHRLKNPATASRAAEASRN